MNTLEIVIKENALPLVKRYENGIKVGERKVPNDILFKQIISQVPIDQLMDWIINDRVDELEFYFSSIQEIETSGVLFLSTVLESLPYVFINSSKIDAALGVVLELASDNKLTPVQFGELLKTWATKLQALPEVDSFLGSFQSILDSLLKKASLKESLEIKKSLGQVYSQHLKSPSNNDVADWVSSNLDAVPELVIQEHLKNRQKNSYKSVVHHAMKLPKNASFVASTSAGMTYFYDIPKSRMTVKYQDARYENVGHPRLLFAVYFEKGQIMRIKLGALKGVEDLTEDTVIYKYPFSNVFRDGAVCWSDYSDLDIDSVPMMFLSASNNSHLGSNTLELYKQLENADFDDNTLEEEIFILSDWY